MNYIFLFTHFLLIIGYSCNITEQSSNFRDYRLIVPVVTSGPEPIFDRSNMLCPAKCANGFENTVMVQTVSSNASNINSYLRDSLTVVVYYKCNMADLVRDLDPLHHYSFQKLCGDRIDNCTEYNNRFESNWISIGGDSYGTLDVSLRLPISVYELQIETRRCVKDQIIFSFIRESRTIMFMNDPVYKFDNNVFSSKNLTESTILLSIVKFPKTILTNVTFNIERAKCQQGWQEQSSNTQGYKCFLELNGSRFEGGYVSMSCGGQNQRMYGNDTCGYYTKRERRVCRDKCFNMPNCSYLCAAKVGEVLIEGGYLMGDYGVSYPDVIGSGPWSKELLPVRLVLFDECSHSRGLCSQGDEYCRDADTGFSCTQGGWDMTRCLASSSVSPYWQCPSDEDSVVAALRSPSLRNESNSLFYMNQIMRTLKMEEPTKEILRTMVTVIDNLSSKNETSSFNLTSKEKKAFATFLLIRLLDVYSKYIVNQTNDKFDDDTFYYFSTDIAANNTEIDIPMLGGSSENKTEFIKLDLKNHETRTHRKLTARFFQFKNVDMMNETQAIKNNLKNMHTIQDNDISPYDGDLDEMEILYKNSDMFTLQVDNKDLVETVKYRLQTFEKAESYSWLYHVEEVCGFLDETKDWTWSKEGCSLERNGSEVYCQCNHLSNFAMLFAMREVNKGHLTAFTILSLLGGLINVVSLALFLGFILFINSRDKLRIDQLNIALCLMLGTTIFLCGSLFSKNGTLCSLSALTCQFLFLAAFVWKLILGINVVKMIASLTYQNEDWMVKYRWIMISAGYSIPLAVVVISGSLNWRHYTLVSDNVCWIDVNSGAFLTFLIPIGLIVALNTIGLFFIANTLIRNYINTRKTRMNESNELIVFIQLLVSMGLTWIPSYFAITYLAGMYIFVLFFPLQGLMMFLLVVVINKENREKVSSFVLNSFLSMTSKSTSISEGNGKSKSTGKSKGTSETENLLVGQDKVAMMGDTSVNTVLVGDEEDQREYCITKC